MVDVFFDSSRENHDIDEIDEERVSFVLREVHIE